MNITREDMPGRQVALTIELDPETVNSALERAYRQMVNQVNVPGFRRGKAPRAILERYVGSEMLTERAVKNILPQTVQDAITDQNIEALDVGDVEIVSMDPMLVKVIIVQPPVVELGDYSTIRVDKDSVDLKPEQTDEVLLELRRESAPWNEPAEPRPIQEGDMVYLDLEGFTTEGPLEEANRDNFPTIIGVSRAGVPEVVNAALTGMSVGEEKDISDTLPDDYPVEALQGKDVTYHATVRSMKSQELPELDEEFSKKVGYDTVDALREAVTSNLQQRADEASSSKQWNSAVDSMIEASTVDVPDVMVNEELDSMLKTMENRLKEQRLTLRQYLTYNGLSESDWREGNRERARERVVSNLVIQEFARREGLTVSDAEVQEEGDRLLSRFEGDERAQAEQVLASDEAKHEIQDRLFQQKLVERLTGIVEGRVEAVPAPTKEAADADAAQTEDSPSVEATAPAEQSAPSSEEEDTTSGTTADDVVSAGGAAELLNPEDADLHSQNESGDAPAGGTPTTAPGLGD